jgi:hypothetical protein
MDIFPRPDFFPQNTPKVDRQPWGNSGRLAKGPGKKAIQGQALIIEIISVDNICSDNLITINISTHIN